MKRIKLWSAVLTLLCVVSVNTNAQQKLPAVDETALITWPFSAGGAAQVAGYSGETAQYFGQDYVAAGSNLTFLDIRTTYNIVYTRFQPLVQNNSPTESDVVSFNIRPKTGISFQPTAVSFNCQRYGTDGGKIDVVWKDASGVKTTLQTGITPARDNSGAPTFVDLTSLSVPESAGEGSLLIYIYSISNTKQVGLANVKITGKVTGSLVSVQTYTLNTSVQPAGAGNVSSNPVGNSFDSGTSVTLTANRNFGFVFSHWADELNAVVSNANPYTFTLNANTALKAVFNPINTYSLKLNVQGGAKDYMVAITPAPTMVGGQRMYEDGVNVTLAAANNPILTFNNWASGETSPQLVVPMTANREVTAVYSAVDFIAGWDFYNPGNNGRTADFFSNDDNEVSSLILRNAAGNVQGWLDKSQVAAAGYEGKPAAVNWKPLTDKFYYQISFNATGFTNISVAASMLFNYNAYSVQQIEYSTDGENFSKIGEITMTSAKVWYPQTVTLPAAANHVAKVYVRWIPDYNSSIVGTTSANDGTSIAEIYVYGTAQVQNDGVAPVLVSSVPANNSTGASASGKVVLNFDEKVQIAAGTTAMLGAKVLSPVVSGQTISFAYSGLDYNTAYTFSLSANTVSDLAGNTLTSPVAIQFSTANRPAVTKKAFDFVVGVNGDFKAALQAAQQAAASGNQFYIFFPDGEYNIGANTGDANQMTTINIPKLSLIGQSADKVIVYNKSIQESINSTATISFTANSSNNYLQDISLMNKMDFRTGTFVGRGVALWDQGNKNIYKRVKLLSNQDTYYSGGAIRSYFEESAIHGTVDFICGGGDVFFNDCLIYLENRTNNVIAAPATSTAWGYVFNNCTIDGFSINNNGYRLGRPWSNAPKAVFLNTTMKVLPVAAAWGDPMNVVPAVFAEYQSKTASGSLVDLSNRRTTYTKDATTVVLNPVLTKQQADTYTIGNVLGGSDNWQPQLATDQATAPVISGDNRLISWANSDYVLCWAVFKDGVFQQFVTASSYTIPADAATGSIYTVRAANEMGGLSDSSNSYVYTAELSVRNPRENSEPVATMYLSPDGKRIANTDAYRGVVIVRKVYTDGYVHNEKMLLLKP
jgi:pectin methylesterase-like acyl-CoA thioesterase